MRKIVVRAVLVLGSFAAAAQSTEDTLLPVLTQKGAEAEGLAEFCALQNRAGVQTYAVALAGWRQRNRWTAVQGWWGQRPALKTAFADEKERVMADLKQHSFKSALRCGLIGNVLRSAEYDPSVRQGRQIAQMPEAGNSGVAIAPSESAEKAPPQSPEPRAAQEASPPSTDETSAEAQAPAAALGELAMSGVRFVPPPGWTVVKNSPEAVMLRQVTPHDTPTMMLLTSPALTGDVRQTLFRTIRAEFPGTGLELKYFSDGRTRGGLPAVYGGDVGKLRTGGSASVRAVGIGVGGHVLTVLMINSGGVGHSLDRQREMEAMVAGFNYPDGGTDPPGSPLQPPAGWGGLTGLWMGTRMQNQLNPLGGMDLLAIREYAVLFADGRAYFGLPPGGRVMEMDFQAACAKRPTDCGLYRVQGDTIRIDHQGDYGMVTTETVPFHRESSTSSNFTEGGATLVQTRPVHGQRLSGSFTATSGMSGSTGGQSTSIFSQTYIQFDPQGTYQKSGFTTASFSGAAAAGTTNAKRGIESGQYAIDGYTLTLTPANEQPERYTIVFETVSDSPKAIFVDDRAFLLEGGHR